MADPSMITTIVQNEAIGLLKLCQAQNPAAMKAALTELQGAYQAMANSLAAKIAVL